MAWGEEEEEVLRGFLTLAAPLDFRGGRKPLAPVCVLGVGRVIPHPHPPVTPN